MRAVPGIATAGIAAFGVAAGVALAAAPGAARTGWGPLSALAVEDGAWVSLGYGEALTFRGGRPTLFHRAGPFCYPAPAGQTGADEAFRLASRPSRDRLAFAADPAGTRYTFARTAALPPACLTERRWDAGAVARVVAATFADLYPGFGVRGRDPGAFARALAAIPADASDDALWARLTAVLGSLDDAHVGLEAGEQSFEGGVAPTLRAARGDAKLGPAPDARELAWLRAYRAGVSAMLGANDHVAAGRRVQWGRTGSVGYLNVLAMGGFDPKAAPDDTAELDRALDAAMAAFRGARAVLVDVSANQGGYDTVALAVAARFADRPRVAWTKRGHGSGEPFRPFRVTPSARPRYLGPVTLLTSDLTVSAGETFVLAMRALPNVRHVGAVTRGALSDQLEKPLPNGWVLRLPAEDYRDARGVSAEGVGIVPVERLDPFAPSHRAAVEGLVRRMAAAR